MMSIFFKGLGYFVLGLLTLWAAAALYFDLPSAGMRGLAAGAYGILTLGVLAAMRPWWRAWGVCGGCFLLVLGWWFRLEPSNSRPWQADVAETGWAEINGNLVTVHNVRNFDYKTETDYTPRWDTRTVDVSKIRGADILITYWGSPWIAHPIISFQIGDSEHLAFSIEVRKEIGEGYSAVKGFFRQFELMYIVADERDVIRLRTNYRKGEEVYAFHLRTPPEHARAVFLEYVNMLNRLHSEPAWYNALTTNCTTDIRKLNKAASGGEARPWDWRILLNGKGDEMMYERGALAGDLPFAELKERAHINAAARAADQSPDFSRLIREGRPGF